MATNVFEQTIANVVDERLAALLPRQLEASLGQYLGAFKAVEDFMTARGGRRPTVVSLAKPSVAAKASTRVSVSKKKATKQLQTPAQRGDATKFSKGQRVRFNLGAGGMATGVVLGINATRGTVYIQSEKTKKEFGRPAIKVTLLKK